MADQTTNIQTEQLQESQKTDLETSPKLKEEKTDNKKAGKSPKRLIIFLIIFLVISFITSGVLIYLYYKQRKEANSLKDTSASLTAQVSSLEEQLADASLSSSEYLDSIDQLDSDLEEQEKDNNDLKADKAQLQEEIDDYEQKQANIKAYNDFFSYLHYLINLRGFDDYTEAEYNTAIAKAQATGDQGLVDAVNALASAPVGERTDEFATVLNEVTTGINDNL